MIYLVNQNDPLLVDQHRVDGRRALDQVLFKAGGGGYYMIRGGVILVEGGLVERVLYKGVKDRWVGVI